MKSISLVTGGFDPIHPGHIAYFNDAKEYTGYLVIGINSDAWLKRKKGSPFMTWQMRKEIVESIKGVDEVISFDDTDGSARDAIYTLRKKYPDATIYFCNGGDRTHMNIPERDVEDSNLQFVFGCGGDKTASSSEIQGVVKKPWGHYVVLGEGNGWKVKLIKVEEGHRTSLQYHMKRGEYIVSLPGGMWYTPPHKHHRLEPGEYIEVQTGECDEWDVVRLEDDYGR